jgi:LPXTG-motif cell wall-anchored protein
VLDHIVIVSENTLGNPQQPFPGTLPFIWTDAQGQTEVGSIAIRYATEGEQAHDVDPAECPQEPVDECEELPGDQPPGFQCEPITETRDVGPTLDCEAGTITTLHQERTQTFDEATQTWSFGDWVTVDTTVEEATEEDCPGEPIDPPNPPNPNPPNPPAPPTDPTLPETGAGDYLGLGMLGALLLAGASALLWRSRRIGLPQL